MSGQSQHIMGTWYSFWSLIKLYLCHWGPGEIVGLLVPPGKASNLLTDHLITG